MLDVPAKPSCLAAADAPLHGRLDELEQSMLERGAVVELPVTHRFTPGLYAREIFMPAGTLLTSKIHRTEHPYVVLTGRVSVLIPGVGVETLEAGHCGVTKSGTRRVLFIHEDTRWVTFHPLADGESSEADLPAIEERLIERRELADGSTVNDHYREMLEALAKVPGLPDYGGAP